MNTGKLLHNTILVLAVIFLLLACGIGALAFKYHSLSDKLGKLSADLNGNVRLLQNEDSSRFSLEKAVVDPVNEVVYLPEFRVKLPLDSISKTIAYSLRTDMQGRELQPENTEADVTSSQYVPPSEATTINCSDLVRLKLEDKARPYNPHEKPSSVELSDGRTLQIYQAINDKECVQSWNLSISPSALAAELAKAESY